MDSSGDAAVRVDNGADIAHRAVGLLCCEVATRMLSRTRCQVAAGKVTVMLTGLRCNAQRSAVATAANEDPLARRLSRARTRRSFSARR